MTTKVLLADEIGSRIHDILAGEHFLLGYGVRPHLYILSPWISNVEIKGKIPKMGPCAPQICYEFESMDLAHAILLARLLFDIEVNLVTRTPDEKTYSNPIYVKRLADFLDEIGCSVFVNDRLHSKMLLTGRIAVVGSLNLTKKALYDSEEIAISIDDLENLYTLEDYARDVIKESEPYGYTAYNGKREKVTRGWLYDELGGMSYREFPGRSRSIENDLLNIESFYLESVIRMLMNAKASPPHLRPRALQAYNGPFISEDEAMAFLGNVLARKRFPEIDFKYKSVSFDFEEFVKQWSLKYGKKKTRQR